MRQFLFFCLQCLYLGLPGVFANMAPVLARGHLEALNIPIDFGQTFRGRPIFGSHKTVRGYVVGVPVAVAVTGFQALLYNIPAFRAVSLMDYAEEAFWWVGITLGLGVLIGDSVKSFVKRQLEVKPGAKFFPWDQLDSVAGYLLFLPLVWIPSPAIVIVSIFIALFIHLGTRRIGYWIGLNRSPW
ncbi:MAG: CDP-archaeol synthase [Patescibacteria group bacterium]